MTDLQHDGSIGSGSSGAMGEDALKHTGGLGSGTGLSGSGSGDFVDGMDTIGISSGEPVDSDADGLDQALSGSGTGLSGSVNGDFAEGMTGSDRLGKAIS